METPGIISEMEAFLGDTFIGCNYILYCLFPQVFIYPYTNTNKEKFGSFFSRALAYGVSGFPR